MFPVASVAPLWSHGGRGAIGRVGWICPSRENYSLHSRRPVRPVLAAPVCAAHVRTDSRCCIDFVCNRAARLSRSERSFMRSVPKIAPGAPHTKYTRHPPKIFFQRICTNYTTAQIVPKKAKFALRRQICMPAFVWLGLVSLIFLLTI